LTSDSCHLNGDNNGGDGNEDGVDE
jgi:hypothetical protein